MFLFLFFLFPVMCISFYVSTGRNRKYLTVFFEGFLAGVVVCVCNALFSYASKPDSVHFIMNYLHFLLGFSLIPVILIPAVFYIVSKDSRDFKVSCFFPLMASFYAVYLPYRIAGGETSFPFFLLFIKPVLYGEMLVALLPAVNGISEAVTDRQKVHLAGYGTAVFVFVFGSAVVETVWYDGSPVFVWFLLFVLYSVLSIISCLHPDFIIRIYSVIKNRIFKRK